MTNKDDSVIRGFMDGIDWEEHLGSDARGVLVFPSEDRTRTEKRCLAKGGKCGIVEVEIRLIRWVEAQDLEAEFEEKKEAKEIVGS